MSRARTDNFKYTRLENMIYMYGMQKNYGRNMFSISEVGLCKYCKSNNMCVDDNAGCQSDYCQCDNGYYSAYNCTGPCIPRKYHIEQYKIYYTELR